MYANLFFLKYYIAYASVLLSKFWLNFDQLSMLINPLKPQAIFIILAVLVIKRVQRVLPKLHTKCAHSHTYRDIWHATKKQKD